VFRNDPRAAGAWWARFAGVSARGKRDTRWYWVAYVSGALLTLPFLFAFGYLGGGASYGFYAAAAAAGCFVVAAWLNARR
jgi:hypothetical protein